MAYVFVLLTVLLTVLGQFLIKWQVGLAGALPADMPGKVEFLAILLLRPWVLAGLAAAFIASLFWMLALTKLPLSTAYPFTALSLLLVVAFSVAFLGEPISLAKTLGSILIATGIVLVSAGG